MRKSHTQGLFSTKLFRAILPILIVIAIIAGTGAADSDTGSLTSADVSADSVTEAVDTEQVDENQIDENQTGQDQTSQDTMSQDDTQITDSTVTGNLEVHFIDVGQGDSILIKQGDHTMMIDFGNNNKGTYLQKYLNEQGITTLDYAIGTHPDADHIGGMDVILYKFDVETVMMPDIASDTNTYRDVIDTCEGKGYEIQHPIAGQSYLLGDAQFQILWPDGGTYSDNNDNSIVIKLSYGENSFLFCADASSKIEEKMIQSGLDVQADVMKLSHHGSSTSSSQAFLQAVNPSYAVISCGYGNTYGHPHRETMTLLQNLNLPFFRTDVQGTIIAYSDGTNLTWNVSKSTEYRSGEELEE